ncbi:Uu.00g023360.m01.CDS01 [Anthostomella pinea]|uniref:Uu.00g023360.m01.CDS01 n=1 Tax=Anthostomella pinea TaxID=933095 RepID=A0AAI8W005_9PEZI|nr:Uu.00g023360.m01.CDS01 [Anthostomella pinea]
MDLNPVAKFSEKVNGEPKEPKSLQPQLMALQLLPIRPDDGLLLASLRSANASSSHVRAI